MHILAGLVSFLTIAGVVLWRIHLASQAAQELADIAGGIQKHIRKRRWQKKLGDPLREISDPRLAATAMMVALAQAESPLSEREETVIRAQICSYFNTDATHADELLAHARWLVRGTTEPENCFLKVRPVILDSCGGKERGELIDMMRAVAAASSDPETQNATVSRLAHTLRS